MEPAEGDNMSSGEEFQVKILAKLDEANLSFKNVEHLLMEKMGKVNNKGIDVEALNTLVSVNSLFTIAVFVGLSYAALNQLQGLENRAECNADPIIAKWLIVYEVVSFSCFLLSSLVAKSLLVILTVINKDKVGKKFKAFMFTLSVASSIVGIVLLTLSIANVVQIKIGKLSCGTFHTRAAIISLSVIVGFAVAFIYLPAMVLVVVRSS